MILNIENPNDVNQTIRINEGDLQVCFIPDQ